MQIRPLPSLERLREVFEYRPDEGEIYRRSSRWRGKKGEKAGGITPAGYRFALVDGLSYQVHRIIWKMHYGTDPINHIDHKDSDTTNNRIENLREATVSENLCNQRLRRDSKTGVKGLSYSTERNRVKRWRAVLMIRGRYVQVGRFHTKEEAVGALNEARDRLHGDFSRAA